MIKFKTVSFNGIGDILKTEEVQYFYLPRGFEDVDYAEDFFACGVVLTRVFLKNGKTFAVDKREFNEVVALYR